MFSIWEWLYFFRVEKGLTVIDEHIVTNVHFSGSLPARVRCLIPDSAIQHWRRASYNG